MKRLIIVVTAICFILICYSPLQAQRLFRFGQNGRFDAQFDPQQCILTITVRVTFTFNDGSGNNAWPNDSVKTAWKNDYVQGVQSHWSGRYRFKASNANHIRGCEFVQVRVAIVEVSSGEHFRIKVKKVKNHVVSDTGGGIVELDSRDMEERNRGGRTQTGSFHEFGHMIGLPDETGSITSSQMNCGDTIGSHHYSTFEQALEALTGTAVEPALP